MSGRGPRWISVKRGTPLGDMELGTLVKLNENGTPAEFYVACHNYEAGLNGNGRTLVVRKDCYDMRAFSSSNNAYASSSLNAFLTGTYFNLLDASVREKVGTTKFYYTPGNGNNTVTTLQRAVFQLSLTELGKSVSYANKEGTALPIASTLEKAYFNGSETIQWTRAPATDNTTTVLCLRIGGYPRDFKYNDSHGSRPAFTLPASTLVADDLLIA